MKLYFCTVLLLFLIVWVGVFVTQLYRRFAQKNPQLGPFREEGCGCCSARETCEKIQAQHGENFIQIFKKIKN